jgi:hypothetical protein
VVTGRTRPGLDYVLALYRQAGSTHASYTHPRIRRAAADIISRINGLLATPEPSGYSESARRVEDSKDLAVMAEVLSGAIVDVLGDTSPLLPVANEGLGLLADYARDCEAADVSLRAAIHEAELLRAA